MSRTSAVSLLLWLMAAGPAAAAPNVLFIAVDDLRPQTASYGKAFMHTPNIDALAERGVLFERAYCMVPTCGASRAALMSGLRPSPTRFVNFLTWAERDAPGATTLNTHFKNHGYTTISLGKVFHHPADNVQGWSEPPWRSQLSEYKTKEANEDAAAAHSLRYPVRKVVRGLPYEAADVPDEEYRDAETASRAIGYMQRFAKQPDAPFFLALGFFKPHLPFVSPKKYWDLYDPETIDLPKNYWAPKDAPEAAVHTSGELRAYATIPPTGPVDRPTARRLIHGYYASVSFIDAQIGRVMASLDELGLADNTIVVLWGDHGWQLGEHGMWNKHSCFETSMHAPLLIAAPTDKGVKPGTRVPALTEFIDIYPTLAELAGLPAPAHLQGTSLLPLMKNPSAPGKGFAVGRFQKGETIRSEHFRFSEYFSEMGEALGRMLYDHREDPDENVNVSERPSQAGSVSELMEELRRRKGK